MPDADIDQADLKQPALGSRMNSCLMRATGKIQESFCGAWLASPVISVLDGDTLEVLHTHHPERIRLSGIDCPAMRAHLIRATRSAVDSTRRGEASVVIHAVLVLSRARLARCTLARISCVVFVHTKGGGMGIALSDVGLNCGN